MAHLNSRSNVGFAYQSQDIRFDEWIELITLCLAPLIAHILVGVPMATYLTPKRPRWHHSIGIYNPGSIIWRYFAIFDRRVRAKSWNAFDMAASNAIFWTGNGWDGSEKMISVSRKHCLRKPLSTHVDLFSGTTAKTLIVTLQGVQAIYALVSAIGASAKNRYGNTLAFQSMFGALAIIGLIRLVAAYWLTEDYQFAHVESHTSEQSQKSNKELPGVDAECHSARGFLLDSLQEEESSFYPANSWRGILTRVLFMILLLLLWGLTAFSIFDNSSVYTVTTFLINLFYLISLTAALLIFGTLFCFGNSKTTIIPCVSSVWYQVYTCFWWTFLVAVMVVAAMQTRRTPCGKYTTFPTRYNARLCPELFNSTSCPGLFNTTAVII